MGLFSGSKKTYVSSVVYNMAGDENLRPNYLKTTIVGSVFNGAPSIAESLQSAYLNGPGMRLRSFSKWAESSGYSGLIGLQTGTVGSGGVINEAVLRTQIPVGPGQTVRLQSAEIGVPDFTYWAEQYMLKNYPDLMETEWSANFIEADHEINITFEDLTSVTFTPEDFDPATLYIYAGYFLSDASFEEPVETGETITLPTGTAFPSTPGWIRTSLETTPSTLNLVRTIQTDVTYSDGRPPEASTVNQPSTVSYTESHAVYTRTDYVGQSTSGPDRIYSIKSIQYQDQTGEMASVTNAVTNTETIAGGVIKTTTTTTTTQSLLLVRKYRIDSQEIIHSEWSNTKSFIYGYGSGNSLLDQMFNSQTSMGRFYPFIPIRIDNRNISTSFYPSIYDANIKAMKKATGGKYKTIVTNMNKNSSIGEIDYAYTMFGVSLNVKENACKKYLYTFFKNQFLGNPSMFAAYENWKNQFAIAKASVAAFENWKAAQENPFSPLFGAPQPAIRSYPSAPKFNMRLKTGSSINFDVTTSWTSIREVVGSGLGKPGAKKGELWLTRDNQETFTREYFNSSDSFSGMLGLFYQGPTVIDQISIWWQDGNTTFRRLIIHGLAHKNMIYGGKSVDITSWEALGDSEESGFVIPLHDATMRQMGLKDSTQMSTACTFMMFNCYQVVKQKWYQTGFFKIVVIVVIIVVAIYTGYYDPATGGGILGSNVAVGGALGLSGTAAIVAGMIANAIAAMIIASVISSASRAIFGDKIGSIIGTIATVLTTQYMTTMASGQEMSAMWGEMMKAENLMKLTLAAGNGIADYMQASVQDTIQDTLQLLKKYEAEAQKVQDAYAQNIGNTGIQLDPMRLTDSVMSVVESSDSFIGRTLMTGTDIAQLSHSMLNNFASLTLDIKSSM